MPGGSRPDCQKTALTTFFFSPLFKHFYSGLSMVYFIEIIIFQISEGVQHFSGGGGGGGVQHFPGGGGQVSLQCVIVIFPGHTHLLYRGNDCNQRFKPFSNSDMLQTSN